MERKEKSTDNEKTKPEQNVMMEKEEAEVGEKTARERYMLNNFLFKSSMECRCRCSAMTRTTTTTTTAYFSSNDNL